MDNTNYDSKHTGPEIDAAIDRAKAGGEIDTLLAGKAPDGFGLGGGATKTVETDFNNYIDNGVYTIPGSMESIQNAPPRGAFGMLIVSHGSSAIVQDVYSPDWASSAVRWYHVRRVCTNYDGNADFWSEWEWPEPPMEIGVEYRTTERYQGKPVYSQLINAGLFPSSGSKSVDHGISDINDIVRAIGTLSVTSLPYVYGSTRQDFTVHRTSIYLTSVSPSYTGENAYIEVYYTKTTD